MGAGGGEGSASGSSPGVKPGALSALLQEIAAAPREAQGDAWEAALRPGATVVGRFELVRELGRGGFGVVWEARDRKLGRTIAFKAVRAGARPEVLEELVLREAEAAARLSHPNIVTLHDAGRSEQGPYLVLELLKGQTLAQRLEQGPIALREALRIGVEVAKGLAHAHDHGVVHRDLTPGNVYLCDDGQVKVLDLGMARAFGRPTLRGGTSAFMAPEQAEGAPEDERTDVFALGVLLYRMLTGALPFRDRKDLCGKSAAPALEVPAVRALGELVGRMLEKEPVKRPRHGEEVLRALAAYQKELERSPGSIIAPVQTRPRSGLAGFVAELRRRRVLRALVGYGTGSLILLRVSDSVIRVAHLPEWTLFVEVVLLGLGFPVAVGLAWVFDLTARGARRTPPAEIGAGWSGVPGLGGARLALVLAGLGLLAATPGLTYYFLWRAGAGQEADGRADLTRAGTAVPSAPAAGAVATPSIAVLPFVDMSARKDQEYFADGIAEEILNALVQVEGLRVAGRSSSFAYKGKNEKVEDIGRALHVGAVLEGSVRKAGHRVRIAAQLVATADGFHLWSHSYERDMADVFAVQDDIAHAVVGALQVKLLPGRAVGARERLATHPDAYSQYLLGRQLYHLGSPEGYRSAVDAYEKALAIDPKYAPAWAGLAVAANYASNFALSGEEFERFVRRSREAGPKAAEFDPDFADGLAARGYVRAMLHHDWTGAAEDMERAISLSPRDAEIRRLYASFVLGPQGRTTQAIESVRLATELDPGAPLCWNALGVHLMQAGQYGSARAALEEALRLNPGMSFAALNLTKALVLEGDAARALPIAEGAISPGRRLTALAIVHHSLGHADKSRKALEALIAEFGNRNPYQVATVYAWRGERDQAFVWLDRAMALSDREMFLQVKVDPMLRALHGDARFTSLLRRMNLPTE